MPEDNENSEVELQEDNIELNEESSSDEQTNELDEGKPNQDENEQNQAEDEFGSSVRNKEDEEFIEEEKNSFYKKHRFVIRIVIAVLATVILIVVVRTVYVMMMPEFTIINTGTNKDPTDKGKPLLTYVNKAQNTLFEYKQSNGSTYNQNVFISYIDHDKIQYSVSTPSISDNWYNEIYEIKDGEARLLNNYPITNTYQQRDLNLIKGNSTDTRGTEYLVMLKEPIVLGNTWKISEYGGDATITGMDVDVKTPNGMYKTVEVSIDFYNGTYRKDYYSETVGLVKTSYIDEEANQYDVYLTNKIPLQGGLTHALYVYYLEKGTLKSTPTLVDFQLLTNSPIEEKLQTILSSTNDANLKPLISPSTKINFIKIAKDEKYVQVDFSKEFLAYTSKDKNKESKHLQAIVNTFARYYQVPKCKITIDGKPYTSTNFNFTDNDSIKATFR